MPRAVASTHKPQVVVLDLMLPDRMVPGQPRESRMRSSYSPPEDDLDHILGLESGADDYVIKPIEPPVLLARLRPDAPARALPPGKPDIRQAEHRPTAARSGTRSRGIELTTMEFELLWLLASQAGKYFPATRSSTRSAASASTA